MSKYSLFLSSIWIALLLTTGGFGKIEGYFFPVINGFIIEESVDGIVSGSFVKERNCNFTDVKWFYINEQKETTSAIVNILEPTKIRGQGYHEYGPWKVNIPSKELLPYSYVEVHHKCHLLWNTITKVYP